MPTTTPNFLTFDIEEWYHANYQGLETRGKADDGSLMRNVESLLDLCDEHGAKATCFVLGSVAQDKPQVVRLIRERGHEVASHGFGHELVYTMTPREFREDLLRAKAALEDVIGAEVTGFRAPSWSVNQETLPWFYDILAETGHAYSSSVYPGKTHLFGIPGFPTRPHYPDLGGGKAPIPEIPHAMTRILGKPLAFAGGFFLRLFPVRFIRRNITKTNRAGFPVFLYLHPREVDPDQPRLDLRLLDRFIHYHNIAKARGKLSRIMHGLTFTTMDEYRRTIAP